jgi:transglutaminase-like putative cysteine protease
MNSDHSQIERCGCDRDLPPTGLRRTERGGGGVPIVAHGLRAGRFSRTHRQGRVRLSVGCDFHFDAAVAVPIVALLGARHDGGVTVERETWHVQPDASFSDLVDIYSNHARRVVIGAGKASLRYDAEVTTSAALDEVSPLAVQHRVEDLPAEILIYTLASRYCLSDMLSDAALDLFAATPPGWERVQSVCNWVHDNVRFDYAAARPHATSADVFQARAGVCRDFAHLAISFCRALHVPARYVFGYLPDIDVPPPPEPMDFCAWTEVYLGGRWWTFDPRNNARRIGRVVIARGRDAIDVAMLTSYGKLLLEQMTVWADEVPAAATVDED